MVLVPICSGSAPPAPLYLGSVPVLLARRSLAVQVQGQRQVPCLWAGLGQEQREYRAPCPLEGLFGQGHCPWMVEAQA